MASRRQCAWRRQISTWATACRSADPCRSCAAEARPLHTRTTREVAMEISTVHSSFVTTAGAGGRGDRKRATCALVIVLLAIGLALSWVWHQGAKERTLDEFAPAERAPLFDKEWWAFASLCGTVRRTDALAARCAERAEYLRQLPECGLECQERLAVHSTRATR